MISSRGRSLTSATRYVLAGDNEDTFNPDHILFSQQP